MRPGPIGALVCVALALAFLQVIAGGWTLSALTRLAAGLAITGLIALALELLLGSAERAEECILRLGFASRRTFPFFCAELSPSAESLPERKRSRVATSAAALLLTGFALLLGTFTAVATTEGTEPSRLVLDTGAVSDVVEIATPGNATLQGMLPFRVRTQGALQAPSGTWVSRLEFEDLMRDAPVRGDLVAGTHLVARGWTIGIREVRPLAQPGFVRLLVALREGGEAPAELRLRVGATTEFAGRRLEVVDASSERLGLLGNAVRIREFADDQIVRDEWVYGEAQGFDRRHGSGALFVELVGVEARSAVVLALRDGSARPWQTALLAAFLLIFLGTTGVLFAAPWWTGRDGDWALVVTGWDARARHARSESIVASLLSKAQRAELATLENQLAAREEGLS